MTINTGDQPGHDSHPEATGSMIQKVLAEKGHTMTPGDRRTLETELLRAQAEASYIAAEQARRNGTSQGSSPAK